VNLHSDMGSSKIWMCIQILLASLLLVVSGTIKQMRDAHKGMLRFGCEIWAPQRFGCGSHFGTSRYPNIGGVLTRVVLDVDPILK